MKYFAKILSENLYLLLGIVIGLYISTLLSTNFDISCDTTEKTLGINSKLAQEIINSSINRLAPRILPEKPKDNKKINLVRPRYYTTELGIREKLFVGVFTSEEKVNNQAVHINKTVGHLVDKIKFFITAQYKLKTKFNLTGLVGFTDTRSKYRPFQVIKYVADTFGNDYDYYFFTSDYTFINAHKLRDILNKISISMDVYMGVKTAEGSYCNLDAGIIISNSVLKAARKELEHCIMNTVSDDQSENLGRCIYHSFSLTCQDSVQGQSFTSYKLRNFDLASNLKQLNSNAYFNSAVTIRPVVNKEDFFRLNAYFLKERLEMYNRQIEGLSKRLTETWPPGQRPGATPATRFDMPKQYYFNITHLYFPDDFTNIRAHNDAESLDIQNVLKEVVAKAVEEHTNLEFRRLVNGYKTFDLSRGMDYILDVGFKDLNSGKEVVKRYEVCKPLGNVEFIPVPYVTENSRVSIILQIQETEIYHALHFLQNYEATVMDKKEKTFLLLTFLYQYKSVSQGDGDVFGELKKFVKEKSIHHLDDDVHISWLSIRMPESSEPVLLEDVPALNFATVDLALKKIGLDSLTLVLDVWANIAVDFLNRVRMNTILNYQIYSPIPFRQYKPQISQSLPLEVTKQHGHFDKEEYKYIAFYGRDYVTARKSIQKSVPLVRTDNDIPLLMKLNKNQGNIFEMFVSHGKMHCMRGTEMNLKVLYHYETNKMNKFFGNDIQLAKFLLMNQDKLPELF